MYIDNENLLSSSQAVTTDAVSTNSLDTGAAGNDIGIGEPLALEIDVLVAADFTTGDETYEFQLIQSAAAALTSPDVLALRAILATDLTAGSRHHIPLPPGAKTKRYLGVNYNTGGTTPTITVSARIVPMNMIQREKNYPKGYTIS